MPKIPKRTADSGKQCTGARRNARCAGCHRQFRKPGRFAKVSEHRSTYTSDRPTRSGPERLPPIERFAMSASPPNQLSNGISRSAARCTNYAKRGRPQARIQSAEESTSYPANKSASHDVADASALASCP